ncbi:MAG TPA: NTF2 fold immunity protein [Pyrinomonadaceae bacterium]
MTKDASLLSGLYSWLHEEPLSEALRVSEDDYEIAVAVWTPIYGKAQIENEKPYKAKLSNGVWTVVGSLPEGYNGGTAVAEISQADGRILKVIHYQ